jgi:drug/metabolite transporter (DMT)-like permease
VAEGTTAAAGRDNRIGFALSLAPALLWGLLPVAVAALGRIIDGVTLTWYRFCFACAVQTLLLALTARLAGLFAHRGRDLALILITAVGLVVNFAAFASSLRYVPASLAQTFGQTQPVLLIIGAAVIFHERLSEAQIVGSTVLVAGLAVFFADRVVAPGVTATDAVKGFVLVTVANVLWVSAALAQKALRPTVPSTQTLWYVYAVGAIALIPLATPSQLLGLHDVTTALFIFCCFNTLIAYGAFGLAVRRWPAARVSAVVALAPLVTYLTEHFASREAPGALLATDWSPVKIVGACLVIAGAMVTALGRAAPASGPRAPRPSNESRPTSS